MHVYVCVCVCVCLQPLTCVFCRGADDDEDNGGDDNWRKGKLIDNNGFLFTEEVWIVIGVEDWRYNLTLLTPEFLTRYVFVVICVATIL